MKLLFHNPGIRLPPSYLGFLGTDTLPSSGNQNLLHLERMWIYFSSGQIHI